MQEAIDAAQMHLMLHLRFQGLLNFLGGGNLASFGSTEKGLQKGLFFFQAQILMVASALFGLANGRRSPAIVRRDDPVHGRG
jgi:hypothetical protein